MAFTSSSQFPDSCYLGRPWRSYARVIIMNSDIGNHIKPAGWSGWSDANPNTANVVYGEYKSFGARPWTNARARFAKNMSDSQVAQYSAKKIFNGDVTWFKNR
ncbi:hypothetical protein G6F57_021764 [Rhizopus arrhizus]|nr:hypothetical protein G6F57_021764 [Rhizopus arrhizus]